MRIDKWLWFVRIYKTRSLAVGECNKGRVEIKGVRVKPSRVVKINEIVFVKKQSIQYVYKIVNFPKNRVSAKLVENYLMDITPVQELEKLEIIREANKDNPRRGMGRPTKRDRRNIDKFKDHL